MMIRRAFYYWQFIAVIVLPLWVLVGRGVFGSSVGWNFVLFLVLCPILGFVLLAIAGLTTARKSVRSLRAVSWTDVGVLVLWHSAIIGYGFADATLLAAVIVIVAVVAFWVALWQLIAETRDRFASAVGGFEREAQRPDFSAPRVGTPEIIILDVDENRTSR